MDEWAVNERLEQKRQQMVKRVEDGLVEDPEMEGIDTVGVTLETSGTVKRDEIHLVGSVPSEKLKEHAFEIAKRAVGTDAEIVNELKVEEKK
jgi:osmotically-inducible protein OsmY